VYVLSRRIEWDAADRLTKISQSTNYVAFSYDGLGRRVQLVDVSGSTTNANKRFVWVGTEIAEERDSAGSTVNKRFETEGVEDNGTDYFYSRDHLGSIREVINSSNAVVARYDYDPYGSRTKLSGSYDADFGYTGHFEYKASWMSTDIVLTMYRVYDPELGRWLSRDPIGGQNLYPYVSGNTINSVDPLGLQDYPTVVFDPALGNISTIGTLFSTTTAQTGTYGQPHALAKGSWSHAEGSLLAASSVSISSPTLRHGRTCNSINDEGENAGGAFTATLVDAVPGEVYAISLTVSGSASADMGSGFAAESSYTFLSNGVVLLRDKAIATQSSPVVTVSPKSQTTVVHVVAGPNGTVAIVNFRPGNVATSGMGAKATASGSVDIHWIAKSP
jgi:RHS repeat-associated protein